MHRPPPQAAEHGQTHCGVLSPPSQGEGQFHNIVRCNKVMRSCCFTNRGLATFMMTKLSLALVSIHTLTHWLDHQH